MHDVIDNDDRENCNEKDPEDAFDDRDPRISAGAADGIDIVQEDYNDLAKAQGHDRQVVALQTQRWNTDYETSHRGAGRADQSGGQECYHPTESSVAEGRRNSDTIVNRKICRRVGAHRHEACMSD